MVSKRSEKRNDFWPKMEKDWVLGFTMVHLDIEDDSRLQNIDILRCITRN